VGARRGRPLRHSSAIPRAVRGEFSLSQAQNRSELATVGRPSRSRRTAAWAEHPGTQGVRRVTMHSARAGRTGWRRWASNRRIWRQSAHPCRPGQHRRPDGSLDEVEFASCSAVALMACDPRAVVERGHGHRPTVECGADRRSGRSLGAHPRRTRCGERPTASGAMASRRGARALGRGLRSQTARLATRPQRRAHCLPWRWGPRARGECRTADRAAMPVKRLLEHLDANVRSMRHTGDGTHPGGWRHHRRAR